MIKFFRYSSVAMLGVLIIGLIYPVGAQNTFVCQQDQLTDIDGNQYRTVKIGDQCWMAENLKTATYRDGSEIPTIPDHDEWWRDTEGAYALYDHTYPFRFPAEPVTSTEKMFQVYGLLYNYYAVTHPAGLCPTGWRIPTDRDFQDLETELGMADTDINANWHRGKTEGSQLSGQSRLWKDGPLINDPDFSHSGFEAIPAGYRRTYGDYGNLGTNANFWLADSQYEDKAVSREIYSGTTAIYRIVNIDKNNGLSVRCLKE